MTSWEIFIICAMGVASREKKGGDFSGDIRQ